MDNQKALMAVVWSANFIMIYLLFTRQLGLLFNFAVWFLFSFVIIVFVFTSKAFLRLRLWWLGLKLESLYDAQGRIIDEGCVQAACDLIIAIEDCMEELENEKG